MNESRQFKRVALRAALPDIIPVLVGFLLAAKPQKLSVPLASGSLMQSWAR